MRDIRQFWLGLNMVKGIGAVRLRALLDTFGDAQSAWHASPKALKESGLSLKFVDNLVKLRAKTDLPIDQETATLALMELKSMVRQVGGMRYIAIREPGSDYDIEDASDA